MRFPRQGLFIVGTMMVVRCGALGTAKLSPLLRSAMETKLSRRAAVMLPHRTTKADPNTGIVANSTAAPPVQ